MITKIDYCEIKHQPNTEIFFEAPHKIRKEINYKTEFPISKDKIKKKNKLKKVKLSITINQFNQPNQ